MKKLVLWDLDGTLLDTLDDLHRSVNLALGAFSLPLRSKEEVKSFVGNGMETLMMRASGYTKDEEKFLPLFRYFCDTYQKESSQLTVPYSGILDILETLQLTGIPSVICTNKVEEEAKQLANHYFGTTIYAVYGAIQGRAKKPSPDIVLNALQDLGYTKDEAVYIGDSEVDVATAHHAGVSFLGCTWGFRTVEALKNAGAECLIRTPDEVLMHIFDA